MKRSLEVVNENGNCGGIKGRKVKPRCFGEFGSWIAMRCIHLLSMLRKRQEAFQVIGLPSLDAPQVKEHASNNIEERDANDELLSIAERFVVVPIINTNP